VTVPAIRERMVASLRNVSDDVLARRGRGLGMLVGARIGPVEPARNGAAPLQADCSLENEPGFLFDALALPGEPAAVEALSRDGHALEFIRDQYRHCKPMLVPEGARALLAAAGINPAVADAAITPQLSAFIEAAGRHRHFERETDPPRC
jgi:catalase